MPRRPRDHAVFLRDGCVPAISRPLRGGRHQGESRTGHPAYHAFPAVAALRVPLRASVPGLAAQPLDGLDEDPDTRRMIAANVAIEQVQRLRQHGVDEFHFYTLNRAELAYAICHALGLRPRVGEARVPDVAALPDPGVRRAARAACGDIRRRDGAR